MTIQMQDFDSVTQCSVCGAEWRRDGDRKPTTQTCRKGAIIEGWCVPKQLVARGAQRLPIHAHRTCLTCGHEWLERPHGEPAQDGTAAAVEDLPITQSIEEVLLELTKWVPKSEWEKLPKDLSTNLDHYLYGLPKTCEEPAADTG